MSAADENKLDQQTEKEDARREQMSFPPFRMTDDGLVVEIDKSKDKSKEDNKRGSAHTRLEIFFLASAGGPAGRDPDVPGQGTGDGASPGRGGLGCADRLRGFRHFDGRLYRQMSLKGSGDIAV